MTLAKRVSYATRGYRGGTGEKFYIKSEQTISQQTPSFLLEQGLAGIDIDLTNLNLTIDVSIVEESVDVASLVVEGAI
jgi:hypothetical protein